MTKILQTVFGVFLCFNVLAESSFTNLTPTNAYTNQKGEVDYEEYRRRVENLNTGSFKYVFNDRVAHYIREYVDLARPSTEHILGMTSVYFPIFERYLAQYNVPSDLRFLPIIESAMNAKAVSYAGAAGLWQFMPGTGAMYSLERSRSIDERLDVYQSTEAAAKYLSELNSYFNDWHLALAAYNCGPGNVNRAIKRSYGSDFWSIRAFLPRETQNYVPKFIAAAYVANYYYLHDLIPSEQPNEFKNTDTLHLHQFTSFYDLSQKTGVNIQTIRFLNPAYKEDYVPASNYKSYTVTLPLWYLSQIKSYSPERLNALKMPDNASIAMSRNTDMNNFIRIGSPIYAEGEMPAPVFIDDIKGVESLRPVKLATTNSSHLDIKKGLDNTIYYSIEARDDYAKIAKKFKGMTAARLERLNMYKPLIKGEYIKIPKDMLAK